MKSGLIKPKYFLDLDLELFDEVLGTPKSMLWKQTCWILFIGEVLWKVILRT